MFDRLKSIVKVLGALGFVVLVFGWFPLHTVRPLRDWDLRLEQGERRDLELPVPTGTRVVVNGRYEAAWAPASWKRAEIRALDASGSEVDALVGGTGAFSMEGAIARLTIGTGGAPGRVKIRVLREETVAHLLWSERTLKALIVLLLIPFLPFVVRLLSSRMKRDRSTSHLRRRIGWIGVAIVGLPVLYHVLSAILSRIEHRSAAALPAHSLAFVSWSAGKWVEAAVVVAFGLLERRAIGGQLLEMRASFRAVLTGALAAAAGWLFWMLLVARVPHLPMEPGWIGSTADFPAAVLLALSAGICEEVVYRGFLLTRLRELTGSTVGPLLLTSFAFGLAHVYGSGWHGLQAGVFGLVLGILTLRSRNLYPAIWAHVAYDLLWTVTIGYDVVRGLA